MKFLTTVLKGFAMGAANVIPGVSGGTIAVVTGIYERLLNAIKSVDADTIKLVFRGKISEAFTRCDGGFLAAIACGTLASLLSLAKVLEWAFEKHPTLIWAFFFGLILASVYFVGKMIRCWSSSVITLTAIGAAIAISLAFLTPASENDTWWYLALCGVAGVCSMIIPGLSGSFVLLLMGNYNLIVLTGINSLRKGDFNTALPIIIPVGIGAVIGLTVLSRGLSWLFKNHHDRAMGLVTGFIAGSLVLIWPWKTVAKSVQIEKSGELETQVLSYAYKVPDLSSSTTYIAIALIIAGIAVLALTEKLGEKP